MSIKANRDVYLASLTKALDACIERQEMDPLYQGEAPSYFEAEFLFQFNAGQIRAKPAIKADSPSLEGSYVVDPAA